MSEQIRLKDEYFFKDLKKEEIEKYPRKQFEGKIILLKDKNFNHSDYEKIISEKVIGVDCEAKPTFVKGKKSFISLIQLAIQQEVYLIRLTQKYLPDPIIDIFENNELIKTGVGLLNDIHELKKLRTFNPSGIADLNQIVQQLGFTGIGLKKLSAIFLGYTVSKKMQISNWAAERLSKEQIIYAATDAWIAREIYLKLNSLI